MQKINLVIPDNMDYRRSEAYRYLERFRPRRTRQRRRKRNRTQGRKRCRRLIWSYQTTWTTEQAKHIAPQHGLQNKRSISHRENKCIVLRGRDQCHCSDKLHPWRREIRSIIPAGSKPGRDRQKNSLYRINAIAVTSCTPGEGKSEVSFRLAASLAETDRKILYIDADLRRSVFSKRYQVTQEVKGLSHYLSGQEELGAVV